ncbi:two-component system, OmpR family, sensor histidine kinase TctE [Meinhardsimonia xiamenensis]|jgi:two-component system sensor histidine kinase TctE|uniref:histidine kinase n=1 Tax=Meinhardsimonia xiamenensis TaxID=990712 RepID=A0A1G9C9X1_9RHOB|nr:sensor histidine kinase [Meinhardsimonia xiamenensis]PRX38438.1 two-component system sensor histidine kinase TctE [Meinhardsimonia xiamenensis]SDK48467.1 two-component system, OmpR family, sensor histidine kinase TctE [Meinhardsimonia xiamenensis]
MRSSLRLRLLVIILAPLIALGLAIGVWRVAEARRMANELLDRNLMFTAVAVARDVALSDGDTISRETERLLSEAAGGLIRYHVYGPDGVLVTGYAQPPVPLSRRLPPDRAFAYYDAIYRGAPVRVLRLRNQASIGGVTGTYTVTVWQDLAGRNAFALALAMRAFAVIATLIVAVAGLVWFGVRLGLKPLTDLEDAISRRSPQDLSPIRRPVPVEARGIVERLNTLFERLREALEAQAAFVSDAAHQLRNPVAGLRALAEAIQTARDLPTAQARAAEMARAAAETGALAERLLTLERARLGAGGERRPVDLVALIAALAEEARQRDAAAGVEVAFAAPSAPAVVGGDEVMLREAFVNLIDNAFIHGGPEMRHVRLSVARRGGEITVEVADDGRSVAPELVPRILARFGQAAPGKGAGLGLSIAEAVARAHGGRLEVPSPVAGFVVRMHLPAAPGDA